MIWIYDSEVLSDDWLFVFRAVGTKDHVVFHNDSQGLREFIEDNDPILCGFNNKHYDRFILSAAMTSTPEEVKSVNDDIINNGINGWELEIPRRCRLYSPQIDLMDDTQTGTSLKSIEAHLGMSIVESSIPFDIDRPLTDEELEELIRYCKYDVDSTYELFKLRKDYLQTKINLARVKGLNEVKALGMTNARLTAEYLDATPVSFDDEREYKYPSNLLVQYIPEQMFSFFDRMKDKSVSDEDLFSSKLEFSIGDCEVTVGFGGIHGAIPYYTETESENRSIRNQDVGSYYPHLITIDGYCSRAIPNPQIYSEMIDRRMAAKKAGDKSTANALKLVANTTYGAMLAQFNPLYDPLMGRSVCITGQLRLIELAFHLVSDCPSVKIIQLNTDGIMISINDEDIPMYQQIVQEWQDRTGFELEEDVIHKITQRDVNNYVEIAKDGSRKIKGGELVRGIGTAGAFKINNNAIVIAKALEEYLVDGTPVEETVNNDNDPLHYQLIAKASSKYSNCWQMLYGKKKIELQKCNRVFASKNEDFGTLYKTHKATGRYAKIAGLPEHCIIGNANEVAIEDIDKEWYIQQAKSKVAKFLGIKEKKADMAKAKTEEKVETARLNIYQKLILARKMFLEGGVSKSGKNMSLQFKYFELEDIVPTATGIFEALGLVTVVSYSDEVAIMTLINCDNPEERIDFASPMKYPETNRGTNEVMALGSAHTYLRRYLYMMVLDICEADSIDSTNIVTKDSPIPVPDEAPKAKIPPTTAERTEIKKEITDVDGLADELQKDAIKAILTEMLEIDPSKADLVKQIAEQTDDLKNISKEAAEVLIIKLGEIVEGLEKNEVEQ